MTTTASYTQGDRVQETTTTAGTGTITLAGAVTQFQTFAAGIGSGNPCGYTILHSNGTDWEVGEGVVGGSGPYTLTRVLKSSSTGSLLSLSGTSTVFSTERAARAAYGGTLVDVSAGVPSLSSFTWINQGSASVIEYPGKGIYMSQPANSGSGNSYHLLSQTAPSTPYRVAMCLQFILPVSQYQVVAAGYSDGTKLQAINFQGNNSYDSYLTVSHFSGPNSGYVGTDFGCFNFPSSPVWFGLRDDGTYVYYELSPDGASFQTVWQVTKSGAYLSNFNTLFWGIQDVPSASNTIQSCATLRCWDVNGLSRTL